MAIGNPILHPSLYSSTPSTTPSMYIIDGIGSDDGTSDVDWHSQYPASRPSSTTRDPCFTDYGKEQDMKDKEIERKKKDEDKEKQVILRTKIMGYTLIFFVNLAVMSLVNGIYLYVSINDASKYR